MFVLIILSKLPLSILYGFSNLLGFLAGKVFRYRKKIVMENLRNSFPEKSEKELRSIASGFYRNLSDIIVETIKGITISKQELVKRVKFKNVELMDNYCREGKSMLVLNIHQCNWEWLLISGCIQLNFPIDAVYTPLSNKSIDKLMIRMRSRFGGNPIPVGKALRKMTKKSKIVKAFALVSDQAPMWSFKKYWITFLNQETAFIPGIVHLPKVTNYPVLFMGMRRLRRGYYEVDIQSIAEPPYSKDNHEVMEEFVSKAEAVIRQNPSDWLWSHRRWKYKRPPSD